MRAKISCSLLKGSWTPPWRLGRLQDGSRGLQDRFWLIVDRVLVDFWSMFDRFLIDCWLIYEWWMTNDECRMINDECWMMTAVTSKKTRLNRSPNSELGAVTSKKTRLNTYPSNLSCTFENSSNIYWSLTVHNSLLRHQDTISSQQRNVITKKGKTDCSLTKLFTFRNQDTISSQQRTVTIKKGKTHCIPITEHSALLPWKRQDWTVLHINKERCLVTWKKTRLTRSPSQ